MDRSAHRWLLPEVYRRGVVLLVMSCAGAAALARVGGYARVELLAGLGGISLAATVLALIPRRRPPAARTVAAVISASALPDGRILGRCRMTLRLNDLHGQPRQFTHSDAQTPAATWPTAGSRVIVEVTKARRPRVRVLWHLGISRPEPGQYTDVDVAPGLDEAELRALPRLELVDRIMLAQPSAGVASYLYPTERFRAEWRRHWIRWSRALAVAFGVDLLILSDYRVTLGDVTVDFAAVPQPELVSQAVWFLAVGMCGLAWLNNRLVLTDRRVILVKGVLWRRVASLPLERAADISLTRSPLGAVFGYGTFRFSDVGTLRPLWRVGDVPEPRAVYLQIVGETLDPGAFAHRAVAPEVDASLDDLLVFTG